ncbi:MAG: MFS transporter [Desulfobacterales bacterium]|nr:MFS transporter [Desulfobacterales bacterium]
MMNHRDRRILVITCFGHFMSHFNMLVFPAVVLPLAGRLNMDMAQVLGISFWMYLLFGLTALPWGMVADRWGAKSLMFLYYAGAGISGFFAAYWIDSPAGLAVCLAAIGLFSGIYHPSGLGLISKEMERVSLGLGYNGMFGNLGLALAPLMAGIVNWLWGPRAVYLVLGGLNLLGVVLLMAFPLIESRQAKGATSEEGNGLLGAFVILLVAMMLGGITYRGATVILPAYFEIKNQGILQGLSAFIGTGLSSNLVATTVTSVVFLVGTVGQYTGGRVAERFEPRFCYLVFHAVTIPAAFLMAIAWDLPLVVLALIYFFFLLGMQPIENTLVARFTPKRLHHSAFGTKFVLTFGVGSLAVKMVGGIKMTWGIEAVFPALGMVSIVLVGVVMLLIRKTSPIRPAFTDNTLTGKQ